jgi:hypothetical protein
VLNILYSLPSYFTYVQNPSLKKNVELTAWTRPTFEWALSCESDMARSEAATYYADTFSDPEAIYDSKYYAQMMLYVTGCSFGAFILVDMAMFCRKREDASCLLMINTFGFFASRCALLYYLYNCFKYVDEAEKAAESNIKSLKDMEHFAPYAIKCGSPYTAINIDEAKATILKGSRAIRKCWYCLLSVLILVLVELIPLAFGILCCCLGLLKGCCSLTNKADDGDLEKPLDVVVESRLEQH